MVSVAIFPIILNLMSILLRYKITNFLVLVLLIFISLIVSFTFMNILLDTLWKSRAKYWGIFCNSSENSIPKSAKVSILAV